MPTELLSLGPVQALVQNQVYALPAVLCKLHTDATTPTIQQSSTVGFAANTAVTLTTGAAEVQGGFLRTTSASVSISLKRA